MKKPKFSFIYIYIIICSLYSIIQYIGWRTTNEPKELFINVILWNIILIIFCIIRYALSLFVNSILLRIFDWFIIIINCLVFLIGIDAGLYSFMMDWICIIYIVFS